MEDSGLTLPLLNERFWSTSVYSYADIIQRVLENLNPIYISLVLHIPELSLARNVVPCIETESSRRCAPRLPLQWIFCVPPPSHINHCRQVYSHVAHPWGRSADCRAAKEKRPLFNPRAANIDLPAGTNYPRKTVTNARARAGNAAIVSRKSAQSILTCEVSVVLGLCGVVDFGLK
jgi:hypothetical protein